MAEAAAPEDLERLQALASAILEAKPRQPLAMLSLGWLALRAGRHSQARQLLQSGLAALRAGGKAEQGGPVSTEMRRWLAHCDAVDWEQQQLLLLQHPWATASKAREGAAAVARCNLFFLTGISLREVCSRHNTH